jgi:uncharacterized RDD family membrane protein YckC
MSDQTPFDPDSGGTPPPPPSGGTPPPPPPPPPPAPGYQPAGSMAGQTADLGIRIGARLIDAVILMIVQFAIIVPIIIGAMFSDVSGFGFGWSIGTLVMQILVAVLYIGYFAFLESSRGQTVGKMLLKLKTVGPDGGNPTMEQAIKRNAWLALSIVPIIGGLLQLAAIIYIMVTINSDPANRGWHDQFAGGTSVIRVG